MSNQRDDADPYEHQSGGARPAVAFGNAGSIEHGAKTDHRSDQAQRIKNRFALYLIIKQKTRTEKNTQNANRNIDEEDQPPKICIHQPAAENWAECWGKDQSDTE